MSEPVKDAQRARAPAIVRFDAPTHGGVIDHPKPERLQQGNPGQNQAGQSDETQAD